jgi:hypothetical protein
VRGRRVRVEPGLDAKSVRRSTTAAQVMLL